MIRRRFPPRPRHPAVRIVRLSVLAILFTVPACYSWRPVNLAAPADLGRHASVRVERSDGSHIVFAHPRIAGDSIIGRVGPLRTPISLPLTGVTSVWESRFSAQRTAVLVGFMGLGAALIYQGMSDMKVNVAPSGGCLALC